MPPPTLTFPDDVVDLVRESYAQAQVILEYGSGGSTWLAASLPDRFVISVESDRDWAINLQMEIDQAHLPSPALVWHVDIGSTGSWGRPVSDEGWYKYHHYPLSVWSEPFFRHPDLVLIDGRFRAACLVATAIRIEKPVTVLFDDYVDRPAYHEVETLVKPIRSVGRMAEFRLEPRKSEPWMQDFLIDLLGQRSLAAGKVDYLAKGGTDKETLLPRSQASRKARST